MKPAREWLVTRTGLPVAAGLLLALAGLSGLTRPQPVRATVETPAFESLRKLPLTLVENRGQVEGPVRYYVRGRDKSVYFTPTGVTFSLTQPEEGTAFGSLGRASITARPAASAVASSETSSPRRWNVRLDFLHAQPAVRLQGVERSATRVHHLSGPPTAWKRNLPTYAGVHYPELWPGIDLTYRGTEAGLKYEYTVRPGADPSQIRLAYRGAENVRRTEEGQLEVRTPAGSFTDQKPVAFQRIDGQEVPVPVAYELSGSEYTFQLGNYDRRYPLTIDPAVLISCGYLGGDGEELAFDVASDANGNSYVVGTTSSPESTFPAQVGPDLTFNSSSPQLDAFIAKVRADGTGFVYAGYIGGAADDGAYGVAVGPDGAAYVTGWTESSEATFPVTVGPGLQYSGGQDAWVARVSPDGSSLDYCGYLGGAAGETGWSVVVDSTGRACVAGSTASDETTFPALVGPDLTFNSSSGGTDAFVAQVSPTGILQRRGYIGGAEADEGYGVAVDGDDDIYITGLTLSGPASFPLVVGPDLTFNGTPGADADAFIARLRSDWTGLDYCGYVGGADSDIAVRVRVDSQERPVLAGTTGSSESSFPVMGGPDLTYNGGGDAWLARVAADGTGLEYCGYVGGKRGEQCLGLALDTGGNAHLVGHTTSNERSFPVRVGPDLTLGARQGAWIARIAADGSAPDYAGYLAANAVAEAVTVDALGNASVVGSTAARQDRFPARVGPDLTLNQTVDPRTGNSGSALDAFIARVSAFTPGAGSGRLKAAPAIVNFRTTRLGQSRQRRVALINSGRDPLTVNVPSLGGPFTVTPSGDLVVPARSRTTLTLTFQPASAGTAIAGLVLTSSDPKKPLVQLPVRGRGR